MGEDRNCSRVQLERETITKSGNAFNEVLLVLVLFNGFSVIAMIFIAAAFPVRQRLLSLIITFLKGSLRSFGPTDSTDR